MQLSSKFLHPTPSLSNDSNNLLELSVASKWRSLNLTQYPMGPSPDKAELDRLSGILDPVDPLEVIRVYGPWVQHIDHTHMRQQTNDAPFMVGITGSVCSGKTTAARVLHYLFAQRFGEDKTALLTLDNFLKPNDEIAHCPGGMTSKGFPDTFRFQALINTLKDIQKGLAVKIPCYDHSHYDIYKDRFKTIPANQKVVIVEGIIAAQNTPASQNVEQHIRDFCQTMVFVQTEKDETILPSWFEERLLLFAKSARESRQGHLVVRYAQQLRQFDSDIAKGLPFAIANKSFEQAIRLDARRIWSQTNGPNYKKYISPSRDHCDTVLLKSADHRISGVLTRLKETS